MDSSTISNDRLSLFAKSFAKGCILGLLPFSLLVFLRYYLHSVLGLSLGYANCTDYDFLLPVPIAFFLLIFLLEEGQSMRMAFQAKAFCLCVASVIAFVFLNRFFDLLAWRGPALYVSVWFFCLTVLFFSACFTLVGVRSVFNNPNRFAVLPCLLIAVSIPLYNNYVRAPWNPFAFYVAKVLELVVPLFFGSDVTANVGVEGYLRIAHPKLLLRIGQGCAGMESLFYFSILFGLYAPTRTKRLSFLQWVAAYALGLASMYAINIFRILVLFALGIELRTRLGNPMGTLILKDLFHTNAGWILYSIGGFYYFKWLSDWSRRVGARQGLRARVHKGWAADFACTKVPL